MAQQIVSGLFGLDPTQLLMQRQAEQERAALAQAQLSPIESAQYGMIRAGQQIGNLAAPLLGVQDPQLQAAMQAKQLAGQFDLTTASGVKDFAKALAASNNPLAFQAAQQATLMEEKEATIGLRKAQAEKALNPQSKIGQMIEERDALAAELGPNHPSVVAMTNAINKMGYIKGAKAPAGDGISYIGGGTQPPKGEGTAPYVVGTDKVGRVKLSDGRLIPAKQFYDAQDDLYQARAFKDKLDAVAPETVQKAYGSAANYTTLPYGGAIRPDTAKAQNEVNALKIQETLNTLGPLKGSTSDKEFTEVMSSFPKYTDNPKIMEAWLERAKKYINKRIARQEKVYGTMPGEATPVTAEAPKTEEKPKRIKLD